MKKKKKLMNQFADNITQKLDFRSRTRDYYKIPCWPWQWNQLPLGTVAAFGGGRPVIQSSTCSRYIFFFSVTYYSCLTQNNITTRNTSITRKEGVGRMGGGGGYVGDLGLWCRYTVGRSKEKNLVFRNSCPSIIIAPRVYMPIRALSIIIPLDCPPPPIPIELGGTYAHSPSLTPPPYLGGKI